MKVRKGHGGNYVCAFQYDGQRRWLSLRVSDKALAITKAKAFHKSLQANGWESALAQHHLGLRIAKTSPQKTKPADLTVGQYLQAVHKNCELAGRTKTGYESSLRQIVSDVFNLNDVGNRYDYIGGGRAEWLEKVHSVKLASLTPEKIQQWKINYLREHSTNPLTERRAKITATTTLRQARSLFGKKITDQLQGVDLPPNPFAGIKGFEKQDTKYHGGINIEALIHDAQAELPPEQLKIFLLAVMAGLRRKEIDLLEWPSFRWNESAIQIRATESFKAKSEDSYGSVQIDPELVEIFRGFHARSTGQFVIEGREQIATKWNRYRCQKHFDDLCEWLRNHGVNSGSPIHTLRKEFGSQINSIAGIHAASTQLRHADIGITAKFYADKRNRVTTGFGSLLTPANVVQMKGAA